MAPPPDPGLPSTSDSIDNDGAINDNINVPNDDPEDDTLEMPLYVPPAAKRTLPPRVDPDKKLLYLVHQFLKQEHCEKTVHTLEMEKSLYFDVVHFEDTLLAGEWHHAQEYFDAFSREPNLYTLWLFFEIYKQIYFEALDSGDMSTAVVLIREYFMGLVEQEMVDRLMRLLCLNDFREHRELSDYEHDVLLMRERLVAKIRNKRVITSHPLLEDKLVIPWIGAIDLSTIYREHEVPLQHQLARVDPDMELLYLVRQFLKQENCEKALQELHMEKSVYFDMSHFGQIVQAGEWHETFRYVRRLTRFAHGDNISRLFGQLNLQVYLEALDSGDMPMALKFLKALPLTWQPEQVKEFAELLAVGNYKITPSVDSARTNLLHQLKNHIDNHPVLKYKQLLFRVGSIDLRTLYGQYKVGSARVQSI